MGKVLGYLGSGLSADVYKVEKDGKILAKKIFNPSSLARVAYAIIYQSKHAYLKEEAIHAAYWRRRIASRLSRVVCQRAYIVDAIEECEGAIYSPFIEGHVPSLEEALKLRSFLHPLELSFHVAGMPVWSFGETVNWRWRENIIVDKGGKLAILDYEAGLPSPHPSLLVHFDDIDLKKLKQYKLDYLYQIIDILGVEESSNLTEAIENYEFHSKKWKETEKAPILTLMRNSMSYFRDSWVGRKLSDYRWNRQGEKLVDSFLIYGDSGIDLFDLTGRGVTLSKRDKKLVMDIMQEELHLTIQEMRELRWETKNRFT